MSDALQPPGADVALVEIDGDGVITTTLTDGTQSTGAAVSEIADRTRARGIATHSFFKRKRRSWPIPRI